MNTKENPEKEISEEIEEALSDLKLWSLVVFNDDINTFNHVISTLIDVCKHEQEQAEQCAMIIHFKGKCDVNSGEYNDLVSQRNQICKKGISAEVMLK